MKKISMIVALCLVAGQGFASNGMTLDDYEAVKNKIIGKFMTSIEEYRAKKHPFPNTNVFKQNSWTRYNSSVKGFLANNPSLEENVSLPSFKVRLDLEVVNEPKVPRFTILLEEKKSPLGYFSFLDVFGFFKPSKKYFVRDYDHLKYKIIVSMFKNGGSKLVKTETFRLFLQVAAYTKTSSPPPLAPSIPLDAIVIVPPNSVNPHPNMI